MIENTYDNYDNYVIPDSSDIGPTDVPVSQLKKYYKIKERDPSHNPTIVTKLNAMALHSLFSDTMLNTIEGLRAIIATPESKYTALQRAFIRSVLRDYDRSSTETIRYMLERLFGRPKESLQIDQSINTAQPMTKDELQKLSLKVLASIEREALLPKNDAIEQCPEDFLQQKSEKENNDAEPLEVDFSL